jgi:hypothetical protein
MIVLFMMMFEFPRSVLSAGNGFTDAVSRMETGNWKRLDVCLETVQVHRCRFDGNGFDDGDFLASGFWLLAEKRIRAGLDWDYSFVLSVRIYYGSNGRTAKENSTLGQFPAVMVAFHIHVQMRLVANDFDTHCSSFIVH